MPLVGPRLPDPLPLVRVRSGKEMDFTPVIMICRCSADIGGGEVRLEENRFYLLPNGIADELLSSGLAEPAPPHM